MIKANNDSLKPVKRMAVRIPIRMISKIEDNLLDSGYNKKQRLYWFEDILKELFEKESYHNLIAEEFIEAGTTKIVNLSITADTFKMVNDTVKYVEEKEDTKTDRSSVIRTAILQRLLKASGQQFGV
ncbi:hypothetical protein [Colwellia psychrerythraea]|uniref:Uncharacterized protein n=1 Tax=Colwellia psychrerythraea TaxID=28229 RepID=A0A099KDK3_COLPS|nr:hypothetical protein [Colwellia psychrerythraea]KGJ88410.1 hypothetical protein ND2E_4246 [Colwellia psychrerythraea]